MSYVQWIVVLGFALTFQLRAQAPLEVTGVNDRGIYTDSASFSVPALSGYNYYVLLDGVRVPADATNVIRKVDYHEISVTRTNIATGEVTNRLVRFIIRSSNRGSPETGLIEWTPYPPIPSTGAEMDESHLRLVAPAEFPAGIPIPIIASIENSDGSIARVNGHVSAPGFEANAFRVVRGHGFGFLPPASAGTINYLGQMTSISAPKQIQVQDTTWTTVAGTLSANATWPANSRIHVTGHITVPAGGTLNIADGVIVRLNTGVNITNNGSININGTLERPVVFTPTSEVRPHQHANAWGGFYLRGSGCQLIANGAIFTGSGASPTGVSAHRREQALFLLNGGARTYLTNCFIISLAGQVGNGNNGHLIFDRTHVQRAITCGEYGGGSTFTINKSALIEFPSIDDVYNPTIVNADYDGVYFTSGTYVISDSLLGFLKDDAIDAGSGPAGTVLVTNCWIESALHEALAWSREGRVTRTYDTVTINSGQGIEAGHSGSGLGFPNVFAERFLSTANSVGFRFGDNYDWEYLGFLRITNSMSLYNYRDIFAKTFNSPKGSSWDTNSWVDRLAQMDIRSNYLSTTYVQWPSNKLWQTEGDPSLLAHWMTTPPDAPVGAGLALWTNQLPIAQLFNGIPVRLSSFTTNPVTVSYRFSAGDSTLEEGTLSFYPGETVKNIMAGSFQTPGNGTTLTLTSATGAELTGQTSVQLTGAVQTPSVTILSSGSQTAFDRLNEGVALRLSNPSTMPVTVTYSFDTPSGVASTGSVVFASGETLAWIPNPSTTSTNLLRLSLSNPENATLASTNLLYVYSPPREFDALVTLIPRGANWKFLDNGSNQGTLWRGIGFNDSSWSTGPAQLGFGENDQNTVLTRGFITYYFRKTLILEEGEEFDSGDIWILRDDAAIVYVNGTEVYRSPNITTGAVDYLTEANSTGENSVNTVSFNGSLFQTGTNVIAVEIHQESLDSSDLSFDFELVATLPPPPGFAPELYSAEFEENELTIAWAEPGYGLQEADSVIGPWRPLSLQGPVTVSMLSTQKFYRLREIEVLPPVTLIPRATSWKFLDNGTDQGTAWRAVDFDDTSWASGAAQLGFGENDQATTIQSGFITYYFRKEFTLSETNSFTGVNIWLLRDDAAVVYLNGTEILRTPNLPGGDINFETMATSTGENSINTATISGSPLRTGKNVIAVEIHQESLDSSDVSFSFELIGTPAGSF